MAAATIARRTRSCAEDSLSFDRRYAGRARYLPGDFNQLGARQRTAAGHVVEVCFMGLAPPGPWAGQCVYQEVHGLDLLGPVLIPESDLDFID